MTLAHVTDGNAPTHALFALGVGFDADMVRESEKRPHSKGKIGALHYVRSRSPWRPRLPDEAGESDRHLRRRHASTLSRCWCRSTTRIPTSARLHSASLPT